MSLNGKQQHRIRLVRTYLFSPILIWDTWWSIQGYTSIYQHNDDNFTKRRQACVQSFDSTRRKINDFIVYWIAFFFVLVIVLIFEIIHTKWYKIVRMRCIKYVTWANNFLSYNLSKYSRCKWNSKLRYTWNTTMKQVDNNTNV